MALPAAAQCGHAVDATGVGVGEPRSGRLATADADLHSYSNGHPVGDARALQRAETAHEAGCVSWCVAGGDGGCQSRLILASGRGTSEQIRLLVSELPRRPDLELALAICLPGLARPRAGRISACRRELGQPVRLRAQLPLVDAQLALAVPAILPGDSGRASAEALIDLADRYGLRRVNELLSEWIERRGLAT